MSATAHCVLVHAPEACQIKRCINRSYCEVELVTSQTLERDLFSNEWKIGVRRPPLCMEIVWMKILSEKKIFVQTRTKIHFWRSKVTNDLIIVVPALSK
jgi:hypothetical protein